MGGCLSTPSKSSRRRRRSGSRYRCAPVKYEYNYTVRNGETLLVRRRVGDSQRQRTDDASSLEMNAASGHRSRHHESSSRRKHQNKRQSGSSSHQRGSQQQSRSGKSTGYGGGSQSHRSQESRSARDEEWEAEQRRNQVAFWARESTRGHDRASSQGVGGQGSQDGQNPDDRVSSLHENGDGGVDARPPPSNASKRK